MLSEATVHEALQSLGVLDRLVGDDTSITDYLIQLLQDDDSYSDVETLIDTLQSFLVAQAVDDDDCENDEATNALATAVVQSLVAARGLNQQSPTEEASSSSSSSSPQGVSSSSPVTLASIAPLSRKLAPEEQTLASSAAPKNKSSVVENGEAEVKSDDNEQPPPPPSRMCHKPPQSSSSSSTKRSNRRKEGTPPRNPGRRTGPRDNDDEDLLEDEASAWLECQREGRKWGGRGKGGRGAYSGAVNSIQSNVHLVDVSLSLPNGLELLSHSTVDVTRGHRYGLIGRNGVGKSTLLKRLAAKAVPGMPHDMRVLLVEQHLEGTDQSALETLLEADTERLDLLQEQEELEQQLEAAAAVDDDALSNEAIEAMGERLGELAAELDASGADAAEQRALDILRGLQFSDDMIHGPTKNLSGGWRMRLKLAQALFVPSDLLLFDECTNHLDLYGLDWLISYLNQDPDKTLVIVSHDRSFLDAVCTDIVVLEHQKLKYHAGNYSEYERQMRDKAARESQILDAAERQRTKAQAFVQKQQQQANKKNADPNKQRQAKMIKEKKLDRIGNYREDGKRYKTNSLKKLSEDYIRLAQKVVIEADDPIIKMYFPNPTWPPGIAAHDALIRLENFEFGFDAASTLFQNVTLSVARGSKVALVGRNGCGKSTLMNLLAGELRAGDYHTKGSLWIHPSIRLGHVTQYAVESLEQYSHLTVCEYADQTLRAGQASAEIVAKASGNVRQYLGAFGLGGRHALQQIGKLSGGERMRLCFATVLAQQPHMLLLDESTNHVDLETLDSMSQALNAFQGSVLMVSHNQYFLSGFCNELWVLDERRRCISVNHSDTETFDEIFSEYRTSVLRRQKVGSSSTLTEQRREKAHQAKRATQQRTGARQNTALL